MKTNKLKRSGFKKAVLAGLVVIGSGALLSQELIHAAPAEAVKKTTSITTSDTNHSAESSKTAQKDSLSEGYKKANYTVKAVGSQKPTSKDMTKEAAAEIGAKALWEMFGQSLEGQVVEMSYQKPGNNRPDLLPQSKWIADVQINDKLSYYFSVDSETGEIFHLGRHRNFDEKAPEFNEEVANNPQEYVEAAKKLAKTYNIVNSPVKSIEAGGQSVGDNNDPAIGFQITGENGEIASMQLSLKDKEILEITYDKEMKHSLGYSEKVMTDHPALKKNQK